MFSMAFSATVAGINAVIVQVEADVSDGLPLFDLVGLLSSEVKEAKERVRIALKNSGYIMPPKRITINLSPADIRKEGTAFDLPIAIAILTASGFIPQDFLTKTLIVGELSLDGKISSVNGILPIVSTAKKEGFLRCIVPKTNVKEGAVVQGIDVFGVESLIQATEFLLGNINLEAEFIDIDEIFRYQNKLENQLDFTDIVGQDSVKRALEIAVAGQHNILMVGAPGAGKTMLARRIPSIMPELSLEESLELTKIYSVAGELNSNQPLMVERPFRAPHHTITQTALIGGGRVPKPGEISKASEGILFLDELPEFNSQTLEVLRQPLEENSVTVSRLNASYTYPANVMLVAAMNPCKCGHYPDRSVCHCSERDVFRYLGHISRPLLDRIDICVEVPKISFSDLHSERKCETSEKIRERVKNAHEIQAKRYADKSIYFNSRISGRYIKKYCPLGVEEEHLMKQVFDVMNLSARGYHRILKVARTIADLDGEERIRKEHLSEAICYRSLEHKFWG